MKIGEDAYRKWCAANCSTEEHELNTEAHMAICPHDPLVMRPGPGWKYLASCVWEHTSQARIHIGGGMIRLPDKTHLTINHWTDGKLGRRLIKINGGNRKRGLMAWAVNLVGA